MDPLSQGGGGGQKFYNFGITVGRRDPNKNKEKKKKIYYFRIIFNSSDSGKKCGILQLLLYAGSKKPQNKQTLSIIFFIFRFILQR